MQQHKWELVNKAVCGGGLDMSVRASVCMCICLSLYERVCTCVCVHVFFYFRVFLNLWDYGVWVCVRVLVCVLVYIRKPGTNLNSSRIAALVLFTLFLRQALSLACSRLGWLARKPRNLPVSLPSTGVTSIRYVQWFLICFSGFQGSNSLFMLSWL